MLAPSLHLRPEPERKAYRLRCAFSVPTGCDERFLYDATRRTAEQFFRDMEKQGWRPLNGHFWRTGPHPYYECRELPSSHRLRRLEARARRVAEEARAPTERARAEWARIEGEVRSALGAVSAVPSLELVDYKLIAHFTRETDG